MFCRVSFHLVVIYGGVDWTELSGKLNSSFDWEREIQDVIGMDISIAQVGRGTDVINLLLSCSLRKKLGAENSGYK